jgi:hypothetical protein
METVLKGLQVYGVEILKPIPHLPHPLQTDKHFEGWLAPPTHGDGDWTADLVATRGAVVGCEGGARLGGFPIWGGAHIEDLLKKFPLTVREGVCLGPLVVDGSAYALVQEFNPSSLGRILQIPLNCVMSFHPSPGGQVSRVLEQDSWAEHLDRVDHGAH